VAKATGTVYVCQECAKQSSKWLGKCPDCGGWNTFVEERARPAAGATKGMAARGGFRLREVKPVRFGEIESQDESRTTTGIDEFDRVLGGGIVPGSLILIGGDPGIGKSTLLLQVADQLSRQNARVLYVSGEESERQIKMRGERLGVGAENLFLLPETNLENILDEVERNEPGAIIVDSIQTVFSSKIESAPGSVSQVREVAGQFLMLAKNRTIPVFLIGHVTKEGSIAGPKALEHIVDTVLYFEGERHHNHRIVRATKNRFGAANELGVFEMTGAGLVPVANPSEMFLHGRPENVSGSVVAACMEGTRPMLVEIQALASDSTFNYPARTAQGFDTNRLGLLLAVLAKRVGIDGLLKSDVFLNVVGGFEVDEPAADLGVVAAVVSSYRNRVVHPQTAVFGEVGLTGEVRGAMQAEARVREAGALGFEKVIMPDSNTAGLKRLKDVRVVGVKSVEEALDELFRG
jgi:DNA repair protein RadA/Sms